MACRPGTGSPGRQAIKHYPGDLEDIMAETPEPDGTPEPDDRPEYPCGPLGGWWPELTMVPAGIAWGYTLTSARCAPGRPRLS
jgi:hypothetical protein